MAKYKINNKVDKSKGYTFPGTVVAVFYTTAGLLRYVVEMDEHKLLHIFNEEQLKARDDS